jgi:hypothetical protein
LGIDHIRLYLFAGLGEEGLNDDQTGVRFHRAPAAFQNSYRIGIISIVEDEPQQIEIPLRYRLEEIAANHFGPFGKTSGFGRCCGGSSDLRPVQDNAAQVWIVLR